MCPGSYFRLLVLGRSTYRYFLLAESVAVHRINHLRVLVRPIVSSRFHATVSWDANNIAIILHERYTLTAVSTFKALSRVRAPWIRLLVNTLTKSIIGENRTPIARINQIMAHPRRFLAAFKSCRICRSHFANSSRMVRRAG